MRPISTWDRSQTGLQNETGNAEISNLFDRAESLHANFYEAYRAKRQYAGVWTRCKSIWTS